MANYCIGKFDSEKPVFFAVEQLKKNGIPIADVYTPYAVHGLDEAMGIKRSRLPYVCFFAGLMGLFLALFFQSWVFTADWPLNVGGKPHFALPAFMPVGFEVTVLIGGLVTVAAFLLKVGLVPGADTNIVCESATDKNFFVAVEIKDASLDLKKIKLLLEDAGALGVFQKEVGS